MMFLYRERRLFARILLSVLLVLEVLGLIPAYGSNIWPQKATAPFFCLDGGKPWRHEDRYAMYHYDTLPSPLTEKQARRLYWAYPDIWRNLKKAAQKHDPDLYKKIASLTVDANYVKRVKDDASSPVALIADHPEYEKRAIAALTKEAAGAGTAGKEAPEVIRNATTEENALSVTMLPFGPGTLEQELMLTGDFVNDIASIEAQSVWDNGSSGGQAGWLDASQDKNIAKSVFGTDLYEITWGGSGLKIRNNGSSFANDAVGTDIPDEVRFNKTTVRYKITMKAGSGWVTDCQWNDRYLEEWMQFKACMNAPGHQRLYQASAPLVPSALTFYLVIRQSGGSDEIVVPPHDIPQPTGGNTVYRHEAEFEAHYQVRLKKMDHETGNPLSGSQFYLYERFEDGDEIGDDRSNAGLSEEDLDFTLWDGFEIFEDAVTDENGELSHTDCRKYRYSKSYCDGHPLPVFAEIPDEDVDEETGEVLNQDEIDETKDRNREEAEQWLSDLERCEMEAENRDDHFHWLNQESDREAAESVKDSGEPSGTRVTVSKEEAFERSGAKKDCEDTYDRFIHLRVTYTFREIQARPGYILHGIHPDDIPVEMITTDSSEAGGNASFAGGYSSEIGENIWYQGNGRKAAETSEERSLSDFPEGTPDGIRFPEPGDPDVFSHCSGRDDCHDTFRVYDHRTEGKIHFNKRDLELYRGENEDYSSYGDTEGDSVLEGAEYGLFAAEDIVHPDTGKNGENTGIVYRKNDLVAVSVTDRDGNSTFTDYTIAPGFTYDYKKGKVIKQTDPGWNGPGNLYQSSGFKPVYDDYTEDGEYERHYEDLEARSGNCWIGRPLLLGSYYIKELSRSEGYELSVNGLGQKETNYGSGTETPDAVLKAEGTAVISIPELSASMDGGEEDGYGYGQLPFQVTSEGTKGYRLIVSGFPEDTKFYRIDSSIQKVKGPHVTGSEEAVVTDPDGNPVYRTAQSDRDAVRYEPVFDATGKITGQMPVRITEPLSCEAERIPFYRIPEWIPPEPDETEPMFEMALEGHDLTNPKGNGFLFLKAMVEKSLRQNNYRVPMDYEGKVSGKSGGCYSRGVKKGRTDHFGITVSPGKKAVKTVYGAAVSVYPAESISETSTFREFYDEIMLWYEEHPEWSYGGIDQITVEDGCYMVTLYSDTARMGTDPFYVSDSANDGEAPTRVFAVFEEPATLTRKYVEYQDGGDESYTIRKITSYGSGEEQRAYLSASLTPAIMPDETGHLVKMSHTVMDYHEKGEEIIDYLSGDPANGYRVPLKEIRDKIEITEEEEPVEQEVLLKSQYEKESGTHVVFVESEGKDYYGKKFSDKEKPLTMNFLAVTGQKRITLTEEDIESLGNANVLEFQPGDEIGFTQYLMWFCNASPGVSVSPGGGADDSYVRTIRLSYRGQNLVTEDGNTEHVPVQVLERPIRQKVEIRKETVRNEDGSYPHNSFEIHEDRGPGNGDLSLSNFRFRVFLKSNLTRLYRNAAGEVVWLDRNGNPVEIETYVKHYPELVPKIYTRKEPGFYPVLETADGELQYEKFFDALRISEDDTHSIHEYAVKWYLKEEAARLMTTDEMGQKLSRTGKLTYGDELYDKAFREAVKRAEEYLKPFFRYPLRKIYAICWDSEKDGGRDHDLTTLSVDLPIMENGSITAHHAVSRKLPYGDYVLVEEQPYSAALCDLPNRHFKIDHPRELSIPSVYEEGALKLPGNESGEYRYDPDRDTDSQASEYEIRYLSGSLEKHPGQYCPALVPYSVLDPDGTEEKFRDHAGILFRNHFYSSGLRIEKTDAETKEQILHDDGIFALYAAKRKDDPCSDGEILCYEKDTVIHGSRMFLEAMGAYDITPFARKRSAENPGEMFYGTVSAGTPVCTEKEAIILNQDTCALLTIREGEMKAETESAFIDGKQITGYAGTPEPVGAGTYVLAELKPPSGYVRSAPVPIEIYSDTVRYGVDRKRALVFRGLEEPDVTRIFVENKPVRLAVSKVLTDDAVRQMMISQRVDGPLVSLVQRYGKYNLDPAYNSMGQYLGYAYRKGTAEMMAERIRRGEPLEPVYNSQHVFTGQGELTEKLLSGEENRYVKGAELCLYDAIEIEETGDEEDFRFEGVVIERRSNGAVSRIYVKKGFAGEKAAAEKNEDGVLIYTRKPREDTTVLFYDLGGLSLLRKDGEGTVWGYDRDGKQIRVTPETESVFALYGGVPVFELTGTDLTKISYDPDDHGFQDADPDLILYHLDPSGHRDALTDPFTGLAYVEHGKKRFVWPVRMVMRENGTIETMEKIMTGRPSEFLEGTEDAYLTGTTVKNGLEKTMVPYLNEYGLPVYYRNSGEVLKKGDPVFDRDGDYVRYRYLDLLKDRNHMSYREREDRDLFQIGNPRDIHDDLPIWMRQGEAYLMENIMISGDRYQNDPFRLEIGEGKEDILKRIAPGNYILEERKAPDGFLPAFPEAVHVEEETELQKISMVDEKTKVEFLKIDAPESFQMKLLEGNEERMAAESRNSYSFSMIEGVRLALYHAKRVFDEDGTRYHLEKTGEPVLSFTTGTKARYEEGLCPGEYILWEEEAQHGYIPASMELRIREVPGLQSFVMKNDHTKTEISKELVLENGRRRRPYEESPAVFALYPARTGENGEVICEAGHPLYDSSVLIDTWIDCDRSAMEKGFRDVHKKMFFQTEGEAEHLSWETEDGMEYEADRISYRSSRGKETISEIWRMKSGEMVRVSVSGSPSAPAAGARAEFSYHFCFQKRGSCGVPYENVVSYKTPSGDHRIDFLPEGKYVLVEEKTPDGFQKAAEFVINVTMTPDIFRYVVENRALKRYIDKRDDTGKQIAGVRFDLYHADETGEFKEEDQYLADSFTTGSSGRYTEQDMAFHRIPSGLRPGDFRLHPLPPLPAGTYYLIERYVPGPFVKAEPLRLILDYRQEMVCQIPNRLAEGKIRIWKKDEDSQETPLPGAVFEVKERETEKRLYLETDQNGLAESPLLPSGIITEEGRFEPCVYEVRETKAPEGFSLNDTVFQVSFSGTPDPDGVIVREYSCYDKQTEFTFTKRDLGDRRLISGAVLSVYEAHVTDGVLEAEGPAAETWTTDGKPHVIRGLMAGRTYLLKEEIPPEGYAPVKPLAFSISKDGKRLTMLGDQLQTVQVLMDSDGKTIKELSVLGNSVAGLSCRETTEKNGTKVLTEILEYADGSEKILRRYTFAGDREVFIKDRFIRSIKKTSYVLTEAEKLSDTGYILYSWAEPGVHKIPGTDDLGRERFLPGHTYELRQICSFSDGSRVTASILRFQIGEDGLVTGLSLFNTRTKSGILKVDSITGDTVKGAVLAVLDPEGNVAERWTTGETEHVISEKVKSQQEYILKEESVPEGYQRAEELPFRLEKDGAVEYVVMEDRPEKPEKPDRPEKPEKREEKKPTEGVLTAVYHHKAENGGTLQITEPEKYRMRSPETGDRMQLLQNGILFLISSGFLLLIYGLRRRDEKKNQ